MAEDPDRCPWCDQPADLAVLLDDLARLLADDLDEVAASLTRREGTEQARWFEEGVTFATMWLRHRP